MIFISFSYSAFKSFCSVGTMTVTSFLSSDFTTPRSSLTLSDPLVPHDWVSADCSAQHQISSTYNIVDVGEGINTECQRPSTRTSGRCDSLEDVDVRWCQEQVLEERCD